MNENFQAILSLLQDHLVPSLKTSTESGNFLRDREATLEVDVDGRFLTYEWKKKWGCYFWSQQQHLHHFRS